MVTRALRQLFECAYGDTTRDYMLRISYVEIYNEVINDLLDPARTNLRVVEDPVKGQVRPSCRSRCGGRGEWGGDTRAFPMDGEDDRV